MNLYQAGFRLYRVWYVIVHMLSLFVYYKTKDIGFSVVCEIISIAGIYFIAQPFIKRYQYFFNNQGYSVLTMFLIIASFNVLLFALLVSAVTFLTNA